MRSDRFHTLLAFALLASLAVVDANGQAVPAPQAEAPAGEAAPDGEPDLDPWPRLIEGDTHSLRVHPPQVDSWSGTQVTGRVAVELLETGKENPVYGVVEFSARTRVDKEARMVVVDEFQARTATLPSAPEAEPRLLGFVQKRLHDAMRVVALDRLEAALAASEQGRDAPPSLATRDDPPRIVLAERPTLLVVVDGEPVWRPVEGAPYDRLVNTRPLLLKNHAGTVYLHLFDGWLAAPALEGPWRVAAGAPPDLAAVSQKTLAALPADLLDGGAGEELDADGNPIPRPTLAQGPVPDVLVAAEPTELLVVDGAPEWEAIPDTGLEFVSNTRGNVFRLGGETYYALLSGRWFAAPALTGPWRFVPQTDLAADFARIPDDSPKENVKASVAGTPQAEEAAIANSIPQTAQVSRAEAELSPRIDGEPELLPIEGTGLSYVVNSPTPIVQVAPGEYYAVHNGVWFQAPAATGPWTVAVAVPDAIYTIPPESPVHYVTYVRIYGSNEEVVEVGFTPGYYGAVESGGVVVCGTGYSYSPWVGSSYYAYPATWGYSCSMTYTPWGGWAWSFGVGWAWGYWGSWYGPYYPPYWGGYWGYYPWYGGAVAGPGGGWAAWGPGGWAGSTGNIYRQWGSVSSVSRFSGGYDAWSGTGWRSQVGAAYNSRTGNLAAGQRGAVANVYTGRYAYGGRGAVRNTEGGATVAGGRVTMGDVDSGRQVTAGRVGAVDPGSGQAGSAGWVRGEQGGVARVGDDYYAAKDGSVYKRGDQGWSQVDRSGDWNRVQDRSRAQNLDRQYRARSSGAQRYQGYRGSMPRGGGGYRGGGRRR